MSHETMVCLKFPKLFIILYQDRLDSDIVEATCVIRGTISSVF